MGTSTSTRRLSFDANGEVNFDHFQILRAIGKGSFGKVCIVQKRDTKKMYAMKYMNKTMCVQKEAIDNVYREIDLLRDLDHVFLVNLWFTFLDQEDMFMVVDLLLGGDLRYHIQQDMRFDEARVKLYVCEIGLALDYLQSEDVVHRDIKPDNILLDEDGHVHITDFNIAVRLEKGQLATSMSGTKPYMAPEIFSCALDQVTGYSYSVDWWSLGICAYEMLRGKRPYDIHSGTSMSDVMHMFAATGIHLPSSLQDGMKDLLWKLLTVNPKKRITNFDSLKSHPYMKDIDFDLVLKREIKPAFIPSKDHLNCDPTYELEEMIIEAKPLHKKKKRLAKRNSKREKELQSPNGSTDVDPVQQYMDDIDREFKSYNRERHLRELALATKPTVATPGEETIDETAGRDTPENDSSRLSSGGNNGDAENGDRALNLTNESEKNNGGELSTDCKNTNATTTNNTTTTTPPSSSKEKSENSDNVLSSSETAQDSS